MAVKTSATITITVYRDTSNITRLRKYLYITDTTIKGHDDNSKASIVVGGVTMSPNKYVLRHVIGV